MKVKQTLLTVLSLVGIFGASFSLSTPAYAAECGVQTSIISCSGVDNDDKDITKNAIWKILVIILNIMMAGVGILAVAGIVYGAVLYASAGDNAGQVTKAKGIIFNVVLGLVAFGLMYSLLNFLIPGGVFG